MFHIEVVLAADEFQLHTHGIKGCMLPKFCPMVNAVPCNLAGIRFIGVDFADGVVAIVVRNKWI
jgi:hypothetical protein